MKSHLTQHQCSRGSQPRAFSKGLPLVVLLAVLTAPAFAQLPPSIFETRFEEGTGGAVTNTGLAGGTGTIDFGLGSSVAGLPGFSNNVPTGPFAPQGNLYSLNFGTSAGHAPYAGKAVDFPDAVRASTVGLTQFTLTGWINATDGSIGGGGNRIFTTWPQNVNDVVANRLTGIDLVMQSNGRLQLGINQAPDFPTPPTGPFSSNNRVTTSSSAQPTNWLFFAITYDSSLETNQVKYYFGRAHTLASLDVSATYQRGMVTNATVPVTLTLGNFMDTPPLTGARDSTTSARTFRGLMDEIRCYGQALTLGQIQQVQVAGSDTNVYQPGFTAEPVHRTVLEGQPASFSISVTGTPPFAIQWQRNSNNIAGANALTYSLPAASVGDHGAAFRAVVSNAGGQVSSSNAILTVLADLTPPTVVAVTTARSARNLTNLTVRFSEPVDAGSAQDVGNYVLEDGTLVTYQAVLQSDLVSVLLTVDPLTPEANHTLTISGVSDRAGTPNLMTETTLVFSGPPLTIPPLIAVRFEEGSGTNAANTGTAGGTLNISTPVPTWSANVPVGLGSASSIDFGTATGNYFVESPTNYPQLTGLVRFTIAGWVNCRNNTEGGGGNRIVTWINNGGNGVDLVYHNDGSLQMGINQWPDAGGSPPQPRSSGARITSDANAGPENWRFFAVTYDSTLPSGHVKFYFGSNADAATLDVSLDYARGAVQPNISRFCIGHFNVATRANALDRMFRGLIDEVQVFDDAMSLSELVALQRPAGMTAPPGLTTEPRSQLVLEGTPVSFSVVVTGTPPFSIQWQRNSNNIAGATGLTYQLGPASTVDNGAAFRVVVSNAFGMVTSSNAILTVVTDVTPPTVVDVTTSRTSRNLTNLTVTFSELVDPGSATDPINYVLNEGNLITYAAVLLPDQRSVLLTVDPITVEAMHTLLISGVSDRAGSPNLMTETNWVFFGPPSRLPAVVELRFEEGTGTTTTNSGALGGSAVFVQQTGFPVFSTNVPTGAFAPAASETSVDLGNIVAGEGGRAIDLTTATGPSGTVGALDAFTVCGWVNARNLNEGFGGNRIAFALATGNGPGFDLVQLASGALRIGVNQWPDDAGGGGPLSTAGKITADLAAGPANWVFFAVTYDSSANGGEIQYYFGKPDEAAVRDVALPYTRGPIVTSGRLTAGNFSSVDTGARNGLGPNGQSRVFRGLIDELQVFAEALSLEQIRHAQQHTSSAPTLMAVRSANQIVISWDATAVFQLQYRTNLSQGLWENETTALETNGTLRTVRLPFVGDARFFRLKGQ